MSDRPVPGPWLTASQPPIEERLAQQRARVLVVDDTDGVRQAFAAILIEHGYLVEQAHSGAEAVRKLATRKHQVVVLDLMMPEVSGYDVLRYLHAEGIDAKAIVVSGDATFDTAKKALRLGAFDFIGKGRGTDELLSAVGRAVERGHAEHIRNVLQTRLEHSDALLRFVVHSSPDMVYMLDRNGNFTFINDRFSSLLGVEADALLGTHYHDIVVPPDRIAAQHVFEERRTGVRAVRHAALRLMSKRKREDGTGEGSIVHVEINATGVYADDRRSAEHFLGTLGVARDVSDQRHAQEIIKFQAYHDLLTQLPNRALFKDRLSVGIAQARRNRTLLAVMFLDLDRFKVVNDTLGHAMGDRLLKSVANRLTGCLRRGDTLSRFGGDEFTLLLPEIRAADDVATIARKILDEIGAPFLIDGHELYVGTSIGIAVYPEGGESAQALLQNADIAMYQIKTQRQGGFTFFNEEMMRHVSTRQSIEQELREALDNDELEVTYQPCVRLADGRIDNLEALVRWRHPRRGVLLPAEFMPVAEETGLVVRIDEWVQQHAFARLAEWRKEGHDELRVAVNVSAQQVAQARFVERFFELTAAAGIEPAAVIIEVTETLMSRDVDGLVPKLVALRERGVSITIDDFGSGVSSLSYLQRFPVDTLKIDPSFMQGVRVDDDSGMVPAIAALARGLRLELIAEGVESRAQLLHAKRHGLGRAQGYLFAKPVEASRVSGLLGGGGFEALVRGLPTLPLREQPRQ